MSEKMDSIVTGDTKLCGVCGDKALGYNFNAVTCESCKAFFRRNALRNKEFKCPFDGVCNIDPITRRFCQKCRLKKCFDIGMKKEWILSEDEKRVKKSKIEENRYKKQSFKKLRTKHDSTLTLTNVTAHNSIPILTNYCQTHEKSNDTNHVPLFVELSNSNALIVSNIQSHSKDLPPYEKIVLPTEIQNISIDKQYLNNSINNDSNSCHNSALRNLLIHDIPDSFISSPSGSVASRHSPSESILSPANATIHSPPLNATIHSPPLNANYLISSDGIYEENSDNVMQQLPNSNDKTLSNGSFEIPQSVFQKTIEVTFTPLEIRSNMLTSNNIGKRELNQLERSKLHELIVAHSILKQPLPAAVVTDPSDFIDVVKMTDHAIRRLIKMSKKLTAFKALCQEDQIALLKGGCTEMMVLRSIMSFNHEKECFQISPRENRGTVVKLEVLKQAKINIYEAYKKFILSFDEEWRNDENIFSILSAIILFTPERQNAIHTDLIKLEQLTYIYLLQKYLDTKYESGCESRTAYLKLMSRIEELRVLNEDHLRLCLDISPNDVGPLLIEIFDLKH